MSLREFVGNALLRRITLALGAVVALTLASYGASYLAAASLASSGPTINMAGRQRMLSQRTTMLALRLAVVEDAEEKGKTLEALRGATKLFETSHRALRKGDPEQHIAAPPEAVEALYTSAPARIDARVARHVEVLRRVEKAGEPLPADLRYLRSDEVTALLEHLNGAVTAYVAASGAGAWWLGVVQVFFTGATIAALIALLVLVFRPMVRRIDEEHGRVKAIVQADEAFADDLLTVVEGLARCDLTVRFTGTYVGTYGVIQESLDGALGQLRDALTHTGFAAQEVSQAATQLRGASGEVARNADRQRAITVDSSAAVEETAAMAASNSDYATEARTITGDATTAVVQSRERMEALGSALDDIDGSSEQVVRIIQLIEEIAFQTNLLSLNAAVEAARAGRHGRGFAVAAQEVRNLAERSTKAARETSELVNRSRSAVQGGVALGRETRTALDEMERFIGQLERRIGEITDASEEQAKGLSAVRTSMGDLAATAASSSQASTELASAAEELDRQTAAMQEMIGRFRLQAEVREEASGTYSPVASVGAAPTA